MGLWILGVGKIFAVSDSRNKNSLIVCHRVFNPVFLQSIEAELWQTSSYLPELKQHALHISKFSMQQQHKKTWVYVMVTQMLCCCVVNTSQSVGGLATVVGMLAVIGLYIFFSLKNKLFMLYITNSCCTELLLDVIKCVKCRVGLLFWLRTVCNNMHCWELMFHFTNHLFNNGILLDV
jgi:hypothetical protein